MDQSLFFSINNLSGKWPWLDTVGRFIGADYFLYLFLLIVIGLLLWPKHRLRNYALLAASSAVISRGLITEILKRAVHRLRPYETMDVHRLIIDADGGTSFPSGHATIYFAVAFAFWGTKYFWPLLILAILGSMGRIFVGVHYPLDIAGGAAVAGITVWVLRKIYRQRFKDITTFQN